MKLDSPVRPLLLRKYLHQVSLQANSSQRENIVPFERFNRDLAQNSFPDYSFIVPNIYHDGHDEEESRRMATCGEPAALRAIDGWLKDNIDPLVRSDDFVHAGLLVIVFDEACEGGPKADWRYDRDHPNVKGGGRVPALIISSQTPAGTRPDVLYHHQSVLRLTLKALGIGTAPGLASIAPDRSEFFPKPLPTPKPSIENADAQPKGTRH